MKPKSAHSPSRERLTGLPLVTAIKISSAYVLAAGAYILLSDQFLAALQLTTAQMSEIQSWKGIAFVLVTGLMLFLERFRWEKKLDKNHLELERKVVHRTRELRALNQELEAFNYSVSHDLRGHLRAVSGLSSILEEDAGPSLNDESKQNLQHIRASCTRMDDICNSLLELSRYARQKLSPEELDLEQLARESLSELKAADPNRDLELEFKGNLKVKGDPVLMRVVVNNLVSNAWKYTRDADHPELKIMELPSSNGTQHVSFQDNGSGFPPEKVHKLFRPFSRLVDTSAPAGHGVGLATIRRILRRHGGEVEAQSDGVRGATFSIHLPR